MSKYPDNLHEHVPRDPTSESIHTCSYYCERPECIKRQRDEMRDAFDAKPVAIIVSWAKAGGFSVGWLREDLLKVGDQLFIGGRDMEAFSCAKVPRCTTFCGNRELCISSVAAAPIAQTADARDTELLDFLEEHMTYVGGESGGTWKFGIEQDGGGCLRDDVSAAIQRERDSK